MTKFSRNVLALDCEAKAEQLGQALREAVLRSLRRRGLVVAISGGIDSACVAALAVRALGPKRVFGLLLPELDSSPESARLASKLCHRLGIEHQVVDIAPALEAVGCYRARDEAVRSVFPAFEPGMRWKMVMHGDRLNSDALNLFYVVIEDRRGRQHRVRLTPQAYLQILAATNYKQRTRKMLEYFHADRLVYAVGGTPNRLEYDQGFFVKLGDGAADVKPIAALYKTQVYALARHLGVTEEILARPPTTDTYSLGQSQEDFFFSVPHGELDLLLWARDHAVPEAEAAGVLGLTAEQVGRAYRDIDQKRQVAAYLHAAPILLEPMHPGPAQARAGG